MDRRVKPAEDGRGEGNPGRPQPTAASEIHRDTLTLPVPEASGFGAARAALFRRSVDLTGGQTAGLRFRKGSPGGGIERLVGRSGGRGLVHGPNLGTRPPDRNFLAPGEHSGHVARRD